MMLSTSLNTLLQTIGHRAAAFLERRHEVAIAPTVVQLMAQLLPTQTGEYLILMTSLPIAAWLPDWTARLAEAAYSPIAPFRADQR
jgi:hypothetical protein